MKKKILISSYLPCVLFLLASLISVNGLASDKTDSLEILIQQAEGKDRLPLMLELARAWSSSNMTRSIRLLDEMELLAHQHNSDEWFMKALEAKARVHSYQSKYDSMKIVATEGLVHAKTLKDSFWIYKFYNLLGSHQEQVGSLDSAVYFYKAALPLAGEEQYNVYANLGKLYQREEDQQRGIAYLEKAMLGARKADNTNSEAIIANNIGMAYANVGDTTRAMEYYQKSVQLKGQIGDERGKLFALAGLSAYSKTHEDRKKYRNMGMEIAKKIEHPLFMRLYTAYQADIHVEEGNFQQAIDMLLPIYEAAKVSSGFDYSEILEVLCQAYLKKGNFKEAEKWALLYREYGYKTNSALYIQLAREDLLDIYEARKDYKKYFDVATRYYPLDDSLNTQSNLEKLAYMDALLDSEQQEKVELLKVTIRQKERGQYGLGVIGLLAALILLLTIYYRNQRIKTQKQTIEKEKEAATQFEQMNNRLKALDASKSRLYTNITHEFRTPLTVILGTASELEAIQTPNSETAKHLGLIRRNGKSLLELINQILDLSKLEDNQLKVNYTQNNIVKYVRYITESFHSLANSQNVLLRVHTSRDDILMDYDSEKIRQILSNLLSNAIKYTPSSGKVSVFISEEKTVTTKDLILKVVDTGTGIPAKDLPHIFDRFYQSDDSAYGGTGIGLALAKELVKLLKGSIEVESEPDKGSTFTVRLPITQQSKKQEITPIDAPLKHTPYPNRTATMNVLQDKELPRLLIIEDNADVVEYLTGVLETYYHLEYAYNGKIGIEKALEIVPDIIISDVMMPEKDGFEVCETLKNDERTSHIPIVLLTAKADVESRVAGLRRGADDYLQKPFERRELLATLTNLLEIRKKLQKTWSYQGFGHRNRRYFHQKSPRNY